MIWWGQVLVVADNIAIDLFLGPFIFLEAAVEYSTFAFASFVVIRAWSSVLRAWDF